MTRTPVDSSQIKTVGYDASSRVMHVEFQDGEVYAYQNVLPHQHQQLMTADSVGSHFHARFKNNPQHPYSKVNE
jgi:hypothetical protein